MTTSNHAERDTAGLADLPNDELCRYGQELGLKLRPTAARGELLRLIRQRQELLLELDRQGLLDVCVWARRPVRRSAGKEELAREIAQVYKMDFAGLSRGGLVVLACLRGLRPGADEPDQQIIGKLRQAEPLRDMLRRTRRAATASLVGKLLHAESSAGPEEYRFLPEDSHRQDLKERIEQQGLVGGIASKLKGVADDYVYQKLNEIESRIDGKLDEIDQRLQEWRDREIANRLKIIKITLVASILVALLSLGYKYVNKLVDRTSRGVGQQDSGQVDSRLPDA